VKYRSLTVSAAVCLAATFGALGAAAPAGANAVHQAGAFTCTGGTAAAPAIIPAGTYTTITVTSQGTCAPGGPVTSTGNVTVQAGGVLAAATASSKLVVDGNVTVGNGAVAVLGCEPNFFPCFDNANGTGTESIKGSLTATGALTIVTHVTTIGGTEMFSGSSTTSSCAPAPGTTPAANFVNFNGFPPYFDNEDNVINGNAWITNINSCWIGSLRNVVGGSFVDTNNKMADPDAGEVLANHVAGNLICVGNNPATQFGDSHSTSNVVAGMAVGQCAFSVMQPNPAPGPGGPAGPLMHISVPSKVVSGYTFSAGDGGVFNFGTQFYGSAVGESQSPWTGIAAAPGGRGYWLADQNGAVANFGPNAVNWGDVSTVKLASPIVGVAASPWGNGYYTTAGDGGVFTFGPGTAFYGSAGALPLHQPVVGIAAVPAGNGYYLVAKDGGVFTYGPGAKFAGSLGNLKLNGPIVGMAVDPVTGGYWLVGSDGGVFSFNAPFLGSTGGIHINQPVVGIVAAPTGNGYYLIARDGGVFAFGKGAVFQGSTGGITLAQPVTGMALG
jgi:hypothetical protein